MITIRSATQINAPLERCFMLAASIDLHAASTGRKAIAGVTTGLQGAGDTVTWNGPGGEFQTLTEVWRPCSYFREVMLSGPFKAYEHERHFAPMNDGTRIRDEIRFTVDGIFGRLSESMLRRKTLQLLEQRNIFLKRVAESGEWEQYLEGQPALNMRAYQSLSTSTVSENTPHAFAK